MRLWEKKGKIIRGIDKSPRPRIALHHRFIEYKQEVETKMFFKCNKCGSVCQRDLQKEEEEEEEGWNDERLQSAETRQADEQMSQEN